MFTMSTQLLKRIIFSAPLVATSYYYYSAVILAETANVLGKTDDANTYRDLAFTVKKAFLEEFVDMKTGRMATHDQATYVRSIEMGLLPEDLVPKAVDNLVALIKKANYHLRTGFLSTQYLLKVLSDHGKTDIAYRILLQDTYPSWLYALKKGATTIWECWEGVDPNTGRVYMSHNHYSPGAVGSWMYRTIGGIEIGSPGYKNIIVQPKPGGGLTSARALIDTNYGTVSSDWKIENGKFHLKVAIPFNTSAKIILPDGQEHVHGSGEYNYVIEI